jgi:hypothetical protein
MELALIKSYPNQVVFQAWLPMTPLKVTTTVTSGVISTSFQITSTNVNSFSTRFGATFVEYRIIKCAVKLRNFSSTNPGLLQLWFDEKSTTVPTLAEAAERATKSLSACDIEPTSMSWTNSDTLDLQYYAIGTAYTPVTFKVYTNNANFGSSIVATDYMEIVPVARVQFRGLL